MSGPGLGLIEQAITSSTKLVSFDVFDTVVSRRSGFPEAEFLFIGQRLRSLGFIQSSAESFAQTRFRCEKRARSNKPGREITLHEIYEEMTCFFGLEADIEQMMAVELEVEAGSIAAIASMRSVVEQARERFGKVVFISDMYLPQQFLEGHLKTLDLFMPGDQLYLSATHGVQKGDGRLFKIALEQEHLKPEELLHVGNSLVYDIEPAKRMGIGHYFFDVGNAHPSEEILNRCTMYNEGESALLAGAARHARLQGLGLSGHEQAIWDTGACVTGPLVWMYAQWVVARAKEKHIRQLYFLARDAYPVYLAVQAILEDRLELQMQAKYIYGSRPTCYALGVEQLDEASWKVLTGHGNHRYHTLSALCKGLMVKPETMGQHLGEVGLANHDWDAILSNDQLDVIQKHALENEGFNQALLDDLRVYQAQQKQYFMQQGLTPKDGVALIDSGWTTKSHAPLYNFLSSMGCENLRLLYIGLIVEQPHIPSDAVDTFVFNRTTKQGVMSDHMVYTRALETLFTSFHGRTQGFVEQDGKIVPQLAPLEDPAFVSQYTELYIRGFRSFLDQIRPHALEFDAIRNTREIFEQMLRRFWREPTRAEAELWSQLSWEWDPLGQIRHDLSRPYRLRDAIAAFIQNRPPVPYPQFWVGAAKRLTPLPVLGVLSITLKLRRAIDRALRLIPSSLRQAMTRTRRRFISFNHHDMRSTQSVPVLPFGDEVGQKNQPMKKAGEDQAA